MEKKIIEHKTKEAKIHITECQEKVAMIKRKHLLSGTDLKKKKRKEKRVKKNRMMKGYEGRNVQWQMGLFCFILTSHHAIVSLSG